jgi:hypothetical protein
MEKAMQSPTQAASDFTVQHEGSIILLHPHTDAARSWVDEHIGADNGFQPYWPTVVIEPRYFEAIAEGISESGLEVR